MAERAAVIPECPACGGNSVDGLNSDEHLSRYQCKALSCLHAWTVPRVKGAEAVKKHRIYEESEKEVIRMASRGTEICAKGCGRDDLKMGPGKSAHERHCDGKRHEEKAEKPAKGARKARAGTGDLGDASEKMIVALRARRDQIISGIPELQGIDAAIVALENVCGGGGRLLKAAA